MNKLIEIKSCEICKKPFRKSFKNKNLSLNEINSYCDSCASMQGFNLENEMISKCKSKDMFYKFYVTKENELKVHKKLRKFKDVDKLKLNRLGWTEVEENIYLISNNDLAIICSLSVMYLLEKSSESFIKICDFTDDSNGNLSNLNKLLDSGLNFLEPFSLMYDGRKTLGVYKR